MITQNQLRFGIFAVFLLSACSDQDLDASEDGTDCVPGEVGGCPDGQVCEELADGSGQLCTYPIEIRGRVFDALAEQGIEAALVFALDRTGAPVSDTAETDADGHYRLWVPVSREEDGSLAESVHFTLQASANNYQPFPSGLRPPFPISVGESELMATMENGEHTDAYVENASTEVGLLPLEQEDQKGVTVAGHVDAETPAGTLVVAEGGATPSPWAVADRSGAFTIFNVPPEATQLVGYRGGVVLEETTIDPEKPINGVGLQATELAPALVSGNVSIVNAPGNSQTSVVLVPESVFDPVFEYGPVPYGLRAPGMGELPSVSGAFQIEGTPPGQYKILAGMENDSLIRDPDLSIAGTELVSIDVQAEADLAVSEGFKVTEALEVYGPGAEAPEAVSSPLSFRFADDSSEDGYSLVVHNALGEEIWRREDIPGVSGSSEVTVDYDGPALEAGMYYRFRVSSFRDKGGEVTVISRTEDLRGVFVWSP